MATGLFDVYRENGYSDDEILDALKAKDPRYGVYQDSGYTSSEILDAIAKKKEAEPKDYWEQQTQKPDEEQGDVSRGFETAFKQLPQLGYGVAAAAGATAENVLGEGGYSTDLKKWGIEGYKDWSSKIQMDSKESDSLMYSWEKAKTGDYGALVDWAQYGFGYSVAQGAQALATGGVGSVVGKTMLKDATESVVSGMVKKEAAKIAATAEGKKLAANELQQLAVKNTASKIGQVGALGIQAYGMEAGEIGGDLVTKAEEEGRMLDGDELAKAFAGTLVAGTAEWAADKIGLDLMLGNSKLFKPAGSMTGLGGKAARAGVGSLAAMPIEGGTEFGQTYAEEWGKGNDLTSPETFKSAIDAAGLGAFGGAVMGGGGGLLTNPMPVDQKNPPPEQPPPAIVPPAAKAEIDSIANMPSVEDSLALDAADLLDPSTISVPDASSLPGAIIETPGPRGIVENAEPMPAVFGSNRGLLGDQNGPTGQPIAEVAPQGAEAGNRDAAGSVPDGVVRPAEDVGAAPAPIVAPSGAAVEPVGAAAPRQDAVDADAIALKAAQIAQRLAPETQDPRVDRVAAQETYLVEMARKNPEAAAAAAASFRADPQKYSDLTGTSPDNIGKYASILEKAAPAQEQAPAESAQAPAEKASETGIVARVGTTPNNAEPVTVRNGVVYIGDYPAMDFETGNDIKVASNDFEAISKALRDGGALSNKQRIYNPAGGPKKAAKTKPKKTVALTADEFGEQSRKNFLKIIKGMGGIKIEEAADITGENAGRANRMSPGMFRSKGNAMDLVARRLHEAGYISDAEYEDVDGGTQAARDLIGEALGKNPVMTAAELEQYNELLAKEQDLEEQIDQVELPASDEALADILAAESDDVLDDVLDDLPDFDAIIDPAESMRLMGFTEDEINEAINQKDSGPEKAGSASEEAAAADSQAGPAEEGARAGQGEAAGAGRIDGEVDRPGLSLKGQTPEQIAAAEKKAKAEAERAEREANRASGPNVTADQVDMFNPQESLFTSNRETKPAKISVSVDDAVTSIDDLKNTVFREARMRNGGALIGVYHAKYDGTKEGAVAAAKAISDEMFSDNDGVGNVNSRIGVTDENGHARWMISPNMAHVYDVGTKEADDLGFGIDGDEYFGLKPRNKGATQSVDAAAHQAATSPKNALPHPTKPQEKAGNYVKGHAVVSGIPISIENPEGSKREGTDSDGEKWSVTMRSHYGYIKGTVGKDKDHIDVFIKPETPLDYSGPVFVIDQKNASGGFDEHKVMLGYSTQAEAEAAYKANYSPGWDGIKSVAPYADVAAFMDWLEFGNHKLPAASKVMTAKAKTTGNLSDASREALADSLHGPLKIKEYDALISGKAPELASAANGKFTIRIVKDTQGLWSGPGFMVIEHADYPGYPVITGRWMDYWEPYMKSEYGVSKAQYEKLSESDRAAIEAKNQAKRWVEKGFYDDFADLYMAKEWRDWWNAIPEGKHARGKKADNYWRKIVEAKFLNKASEQKATKQDFSAQEQYQEVINDLDDAEIVALFKEANLAGDKTLSAAEKRSILRDENEADIFPLYELLVDEGRLPTDYSADPDTTIEPDWEYEVANFPDPGKTVKATEAAGKNYISKDEAAARLAEWKAEAKRIGREEDHSNDVIISLFDASGEISQPWRDAGYDVRQYDIELGDDLMEFFPIGDIMEMQEEGKNIVGVIAQPPCTTFSSSGARWWKTRHDKHDRGMVNKMFGYAASRYFSKPNSYTKALASLTDAIIGETKPKFWAVENPVGRIATEMGMPKPVMTFDPHVYGDPYTKRTQLWGKFNPNLPTANVEPTLGSLMHKLWSTSEKNGGERSKTPTGMAYAFFMANKKFGESATERYQWMRNKEGGQGAGNRQTITPLTEKLYNDLLRNKVAGDISFAEWKKKYGKKETHISFIDRYDGQRKVTGTGTLADLRPIGGMNDGWAIKVDSFDSAEAMKQAGTADSDVVKENPIAYRVADNKVSRLEALKTCLG